MAFTSCRATRAERAQPMAGDALVEDPVLTLTHAIDLSVSPARAWPWLVQMGAGRGGWYSWDRLDNGGRPSADRLVPEHQRVAPGDVLPAIPGATDVFRVARVEPGRELILAWPAPDGGQRGSWEFLLLPAARGRSRVVVRARLGARALAAAREGTAGPGEPVASRIERAVLRLPLVLLRPLGALGHRVMQARQLRGIKRRAERDVRWGATGDELARAMPGDGVVPTPSHHATWAVTVRARPEEIWPWLVQMGKGRGGLYSIDWLDRLFGFLDAPSADRVLPEWQGLAPGDVIPVGRTRGWPVHAMDPRRTLVLRIAEDDILVTQSWGLYPLDAETTRLVLRVRAAVPAGPRSAVLLALLVPQEQVMVRAQLRGIRRRAETLARARVTAPAL
ncbi:hypothetical protein [Anaeromyxobacter oryzae]|uniref:Polyketide cyclase/dehydrase n=1 Tax=Anaeromyxobacter oryzae TaxID=2918170 RepID=A0ABM7WPE6_9BACT|nr:hypothetical protein [Anaeromyxobacter oryzae]BDG01341.1 hypothetical protein AMOR_03370 [Anaeromyxobacter oryzae]